jgi:hypothetical protein
MPRANATVPPEAIRIEDEVWQEAFTRREPARANRRRRLQAIDGGQTDWLLEQSADSLLEPIPASDDGTSTLSAAHDTPGSVSTATTSAPPESSSERSASTASRTAPPARRTVKIQGRGAERHLPLPETSRRRPPRRAYERSGFRPDRLAMWAVLLGFLLVLVAIVSGHG